MRVLDTDDFHEPLARLFFTDEFWRRAKKRKHIHPPCPSVKMELTRIERFQRKLTACGYNRFTEDDFFRLWRLVFKLQPVVKTRVVI